MDKIDGMINYIKFKIIWKKNRYKNGNIDRIIINWNLD